MVAVALAGCVVVDPGDREHPGPVHAPGSPVAGPPPRVPPGHMPPPGLCRIWLPGRPPGHQPPPGRCEELRYRVPPGAFLIGG